jgi:hypothetical protein
MKCIIPLAGPDIYTEEYGLKPAYKIDGEPLLVKAIQSRNWYGKGKSLSEDDLIFVVRESNELSEVRSFLQSNFPKGKQVIIPDYTQGALMSTLAGISLIKNFTEPIVVDLVDILFNSVIDPVKLFNENSNIAGIIPYFKSENPKFSYLKLDNDKNVLMTKEKEVISENASAGVYFFKNVSTFLQAASFSIAYYKKMAHNNLLFLCPSFNGIIDDGKLVKAVVVTDQKEISLKF